METVNPSGSRPPGPSTYFSFSKTKVTNIPIITDLRKELDYGHAHARRDIVFYNTFLDHDDKGMLFWPDDPASTNYGKLQYSKEPRRIKRLLVQLFFKINQQHKWKGSHRTLSNPQPSEYSSLDHQENDRPSGSAINPMERTSTEPREQTDINNRERGHSVEDAIDVDRDDATTSTPDPPYTSQSFQPRLEEAVGEGVRSSHEEIKEPRANAPMAPMTDPCNVPHSPELDIPVATEHVPHGTKRLASSERDEDAPCAKRPRSQHDAPNEDNTQPADSTGGSDDSDDSTNHTSSGAVLPRATPTLRRSPPNNDGFVTGHPPSEVLEPPSAAASLSTLGADTSQDTAAEAESIRPSPSVPELPQWSAAKSGSHTTESRDEGHPPPPTVPDNDMTRKPAPNPQPEHEPEDEPSKQRRILPKVHLMFSVNVSQTLNKSWRPKGTFQEKSLGELVKELPLEGNFHGLQFALEAPGNKRSEIEVLLDNEEVFEWMKGRFQQKVMDIRRNYTGSTKMLNFEILITPLRDSKGKDSEEYESDNDDLVIF
ncbi:hypothetical protein G7Z17_g12113 [Cylindrodendrum hubeiense]|uniref:Uncharacterized protein n=1 Tax=Cylindrodendrum hubeiense TaxID=595255 RepID=A0A9P5H2N3_9HYPO|nr:hypothetical protein G7Z17_g12113 [Cylindrodendrum hubeiense]